MEKKVVTLSTKNGHIVNIDFNNVESVMDVSTSITSESNTVINMKSGATHFVMQRFNTVNELWTGEGCTQVPNEINEEIAYVMEDVNSLMALRKLLEQIDL